MSEEEKRKWLKITRPCGRCKKYFSYTFGDKDATCPDCGWKIRDNVMKGNEDE